MRLVHGGASLAPSALHGAAFPPDRLGAARGRVAALAAELVGVTDTIAVDAGPTAYALARALPESFSGSVITHSMPVVQLLAEQSTGARLVALGGELRADRHAFVGPSTEAALAGLRARTFFLEPAAVDPRGLYAGSPAEASVQRRLMDIADDVVMIATADVTRSSAPALIASLDHVTAVRHRRAGAGRAVPRHCAGRASRRCSPSTTITGRRADVRILTKMCESHRRPVLRNAYSTARLTSRR